MGIIFSRFRSKPSTKEILEELEKNIQAIDEFKATTEHQQKYLVGSLILYSVLMYIIGAVVFYFYYFPRNLREGVLHCLPLLLFPFLVVILKKLLHIYFKQRIERNEEKLRELRKKKRNILDTVMETETYKVAKELLERFDPELLRRQLRISESAIMARYGFPAIEMDMRRRAIAERRLVPPPVRKPLGAIPLGPPPGAKPLMLPSPSTQLMQHRPQQGTITFVGVPQNGQQLVRPQGIPFPRPLIPRDRTMMDRVIDFLVGDGPGNRYALICKFCQSHNGMALKEEFEFVTFRCGYCYQWNPARKQRSTAPLALPSAAQRPVPESREPSEEKLERPLSAGSDEISSSNMNDSAVVSTTEDASKEKADEEGSTASLDETLDADICDRVEPDGEVSMECDSTYLPEELCETELMVENGETSVDPVDGNLDHLEDVAPEPNNNSGEVD